jgi:hypothetical protein
VWTSDLRRCCLYGGSHPQILMRRVSGFLNGCSQATTASRVYVKAKTKGAPTRSYLGGGTCLLQLILSFFKKMGRSSISPTATTFRVGVGPSVTILPVTVSV